MIQSGKLAGKGYKLAGNQLALSQGGDILSIRELALPEAAQAGGAI